MPDGAIGQADGAPTTTEQPEKGRGRRIAAMASALILAVLVVGAVPELLAWIHRDEVAKLVKSAPRRPDRWSSLAVEGAGRPESVELTLVYGKDGLTGRYAFKLAAGTEVLRQVEAGMDGDDANRFVDLFLGWVLVRDSGDRFSERDRQADLSLRFRSPQVTRPPGDAYATVVIRSAPLTVGTVSQISVADPFGLVYTRPGDASPTTVKVDAGPDGHVNAAYGRFPDERGPHSSTFLRRLDIDRSPVMFEVRKDARPLGTGGVVSRYGGVSLPYHLHVLVVRLHEALPLLFLLYVLVRGRRELGEGLRPVAQAVRLAVAFHVTVAVGEAMVFASLALRERLSRDTLASVSGRLPSGAAGIGALLALGVVVLPVAALASRRLDVVAPLGRVRLRRVLAVSAAAAAVTGLVAATTHDEAVAATVGLAIVLVIALAGLVRAAAGKQRIFLVAPAVVLSGALAVGAGFYMPVGLVAETGWVRTVSVSAFLAFAITSTALFAGLLTMLVREFAAGASPRLRRALSLAPFAALAVVVAPSVWAVVRKPAGSRVNPWSVLSLAYALDWLVYLPAVAGLFLVLRCVSGPDLRVSRSTVRLLGIALLLLLVFSDWARWFYLPLPFLLSALLAATLLLPKAKTEAAPYAGDGSALKYVLEAQLLRSRLNSLRQKHRAGDGKSGEFESQATALTTRIEELDRKAVLGGDPYTLPASRSRWTGGAKGAAYGFMLSIPWMVLYLVQRFSRTFPGGDYPLLPLIGSVPYFALQWTIYGFVIGYFFDLLRGRTGIEKAAWLFVVLLVHNAFVALLESNPDWKALAFWAMQTFVTLILIGLLVGDYQIIRRAGLAWRDLVEIHNVRWIAAWGSSVAIAIGGVALTLFTTAAKDLYEGIVRDKPPAAVQPQNTASTTPPGNQASK